MSENTEQDNSQTMFCVTDDSIDVEPDGNHSKCDYCNYRSKTRFVLASSEDEVERMLTGAEDGQEYNGFCGLCMCDMISVNRTIAGMSSHYTLERGRDVTVVPNGEKQ